MRAKADGAIGDRRPRGNSRQVLRIHALAVEINHVARLGHGDIDAKNCCVRHAVEREQVTIEIRDGKDEASTRPIREANYCTLDVRRVDRVGQNLVYVINGQPVLPRLARDQISIRSRTGAIERTNDVVPVRSSWAETWRDGLCVNKRQSDARNDYRARRSYIRDEAGTSQSGECSKFVWIIKFIVIRISGCAGNSNATYDVAVFE